MRKLGILLASAAMALLPMACKHSSEPEVTPARPHPHLSKPAYLPASARALLTERMNHHGHAMSDLMWAVLFLDHEATKQIAHDISQEPRLARPIHRDAAELNSQLPPQFFDYQDQLLVSAKKVKAAAESKDDQAISKAFSELSATCIGCHSSYLKDPPAR